MVSRIEMEGLIGGTRGTWPNGFGVLRCSIVRRMACVRGTEGTRGRWRQVVRHENLSWATADSARKRSWGLTRAATPASIDASMAHPTAVALYLRGASGHVAACQTTCIRTPNVSDPAGVTSSKSMILCLTFRVSMTKPCWLKRICMYMVAPLSAQARSQKRNLQCLQLPMLHFSARKRTEMKEKTTGGGGQKWNREPESRSCNAHPSNSDVCFL